MTTTDLGNTKRNVIQMWPIAVPLNASRPSLSTRFYPSDQMKQDEMGGAYGTYGGHVRYTQGFGGETWRKGTALKT